ncbi:MAG: cation:proton antiporter [Rhodothermales bacterium]
MELDLVNLLLVLVAAWVAGHAANRVGYPSVLGEILAGILLGPPLLGLMHGSEAISILAEVGVLLMMLYIGIEVNPRDLTKVSWAGGLAAIGGFITPFAMAYVVVLWFGGTHLAGMFVGIAAGITSLATKSRILVDLKLLDTRIAHVLMAGALVSDTLSLIIFAGIMGVAQSGTLDFVQLGLVVLKAAGFFAVTIVIGMKVFPYVGKQLSARGYTHPTFTFTLVLIIAVLFGELAELAGLHSILGAFIAGLFIQENVLGRTLSHKLTEAVREASIGFLAPIFFVTAGFAVSFSVFQADLAFFLSIMAVATIGKVVGTAVFYLPTGYGWREGITIGAGMNGRGAVEIIVAGIGLEMGLITQEIFSILVFMAIFTTAAVPLFLKWGAEWLRRRGELVRTDEERQGILIVGAEPLAQRLALLMGPYQPVWLVDVNADRCATAGQQGLDTVCGNALQESVLSEAHAAEAATIVAMTSNAEVNVLTAQLASEVFGVPNVVVLQTRSEGAGQRSLLARLNASVLFGGPVLPQTWNDAIKRNRVSSTRVDADTFPSTKANDIYRFLVDEENRLPIIVEGTDETTIFDSDTVLRAGDVLHVLDIVPSGADLPTSDHTLTNMAKDCPIIDLEEAADPADVYREAARLFASMPGVRLSAAKMEAAFVEQAVDHPPVIVPGLAVPHLVLEGTDLFHMVLFRSRTGVHFPSGDAPVHAVFVLIRSADQRRRHLQTLASIAHLVQHPDYEERWKEAEGPDDLRTLLIQTTRTVKA